MKVEVYEGCYNDLIMGTAIAVTYLRVGDEMAMIGQYLESATINYTDLIALNRGLASVVDGNDYVIRTNNNYIAQVVENCQSWRSQGIVEQKAHPEQVIEILSHIDRLGTGELRCTRYGHGRDEYMLRLLKHAKHFYHYAQTEMIRNKTTALERNLFGEPVIMKIEYLPGSILWKKPFGVAEFQKRMAKARATQTASILTLLPGGKNLS